MRIFTCMLVSSDYDKCAWWSSARMIFTLLVNDVLCESCFNRCCYFSILAFGFERRLTSLTCPTDLHVTGGHVCVYLAVMQSQHYCIHTRVLNIVLAMSYLLKVVHFNPTLMHSQLMLMYDTSAVSTHYLNTDRLNSYL